MAMEEPPNKKQKGMKVPPHTPPPPPDAPAQVAAPPKTTPAIATAQGPPKSFGPASNDAPSMMEVDPGDSEGDKDNDNDAMEKFSNRVTQLCEECFPSNAQVDIWDGLSTQAPEKAVYLDVLRAKVPMMKGSGICYINLQNPRSGAMTKGTGHISFLNFFTRNSYPMVPYTRDIREDVERIMQTGFNSTLEITHVSSSGGMWTTTGLEKGVPSCVCFSVDQMQFYYIF